MVQSAPPRKNTLHDLGYKIFLDRYAQKDMTRSTLRVGDVVIVVVNPQTGQREIGKVTAMNLPQVTIELLDGEVVTRDLEHVDKPLETEPEQMMERVAAGIAAVEATPELRAQWQERFRWLLDDFRFVPAGRILAAAGTKQELTFYNCLPPEQEILTAEGYKPIAEVRVGELVVTHKNRLRPVRHKMERETQESLYIIRPGKLGFDDLRVTGEHKILVIRAQWVNDKHRSRDGLRLRQEPAWIPAKELQAGDYVSSTYTAEIAEPELILAAALASEGSPAELPVWALFPGTVPFEPDFEYDNLRWVRIDEIAVEDYTGVVMDIEVDEDHSFVSAGVVVSNCYVVPSPRDSREGIIETLRQMTEIMSRGGGVGINISSLRPRHAYVKGVNGRSSGSVSWGALYSFVTGLIEQGGCFGPDERIFTDKGLIPAREIADRMDAGEVFRAHTHQGPRRITHPFRNGTKPLYELTTQRGYRLRITEDHKVAVLMDGKITTMALKYLQQGDEILLLLGQGVQGEYLPLSPVQYDRSIMSTTLNTDVRLPAVLNEDLAYLVGYMHGDGYVHMGKKVNWTAPKAVKMATADAYPQIRQRIVDSIERVFGLQPTLEEGDGMCKNVSLYSRLAIEFLITNGLLKAKAEHIRVPEAVFRSPSSVQAAFIAGYFDADGCNRGRKAGYGIDSVSREMLEDVQQLLALNGILSAIHATDRSQQGWRTIYRLTVTGGEFKKRFTAFVDTAKRSDDTGKREMYNTYPANVWTALGARSKYRQRIYDGVSDRISFGQLTAIRERLAADGQDAAVAEINDLLHTIPDRIAAITPLGDSDVYDFEVEDVHLLSGAGVYTSNSRRGALMLILHDWHPDVFDFINSKREMGRITNANISVGVSDKLMAAVKADADWDLVFPDTTYPDYTAVWDGDLDKWIAAGRRVVKHRTVRARDVWNAIVESAWASAEPGVWFSERSDKMSNSWYFNPLICTNPCGEQSLGAWSVCNLGALNFAKFYDPDSHDVNWTQLERAARYATRFLDNVIDSTPYFFEENRERQLAERRVGLNSMGLAELLILLGIRYGSDESVAFIDRLYEFLATVVYDEAVELAREKGAFTEFDADKFLQSGYMQAMPERVRERVQQHGIRNVTLLTQAPTGTTGTMVNTSTGIEPFFSWVYYRKSRLGLHEEHVPLVRDWLDAHPGQTTLPDYFVTAMDLSPEEHVRVQAAIQRWVDSSISKTANLPNDYTVEQVSALYQYMYELGCKGGTIYRDGSRDEQVLMRKGDERAEKELADRKPAAEPAVEQVATPHRVYPRPKKLSGVTITCKTPFGTAYVTLNSDENGQPFEVFIVAPGKAGSDLQADAEGLGRMISLALRTTAPANRMDMLRLIIEQLKDIGGSSKIGFGPSRVSSLPDAVAQAMEQHYFAEPAAQQIELPLTPVMPALPTSGHTGGSADEKRKNGKVHMDLCPSCGAVALVHAEGCATCTNCGYSKC